MPVLVNNKPDFTATQGYSDSRQDHSYTYDSGVVVLPQAGRSPNFRIIRLHGGLGMRTSDWKMSRKGKPPTIPSMANTSEDIFLGGSVVPSLPRPSTTRPDSYDWTVRGSYTYVQAVPRIAGSSAFPVGQHPFLCVDQAATANAIGQNVLPYYSGSLPLQSVAAKLTSTVTIEPDGDFAWPFLVIPADFSSSHLLQD